MMRILRKGERYVLNKPKEKNYFLSSYIRQCIVLLIGLFSFQFVCLAQESPVDREATEHKSGIASDAIKINQVSDRIRNQLIQFDPEADLKRFPPVEYWVDFTKTYNIKVGDTLPPEVLNLPIWVSKGEKDDTVTLSEYSSKKLIVLDFWAKFCKPCIESVDKWEEYAQEIGSPLEFLPVLLDYDYKAKLMADRRGWLSTMVIGKTAYLFNSFFFERPVISRLVWIKGERVIAITGTKGYDLQLVKDVIAGREVDIPMDLTFTYSSK